jgi:replicative DNA helicase
MNLDLDQLETVIAYKCLTDETYLASVVDYLQPVYFRQKDIQAIVGIIAEFYSKRNAAPTLTEIKNYLTTDVLKTQFKNAVGLFSGIDKNLNRDELYENTETFLKERAVFHTLTQVINSTGKEKTDTAGILTQFEKSCNICLNYDVGIDLLPQIDRVCKDLHQENPYITTGWKWLDDKLGGGLMEQGRAMYVFAGETNIGKSIFLGNIASHIATQNKTVLVVSLEMSEMMYARRLCTNLTKIPIVRLKEDSELLKTQITDIASKLPRAKVLIKEFPPSTLTVNQLRGFIKKLTGRGLKIDAIVLDYINLLHSTTGNNSYERIKYCAEQLRALSYIFNCPIITATQLNRTGYGVDEPGLQTISESMALPNTADFMAGIWQDDTDRQLGVIKMGLMKNRFGPNFGNVSMRIDYSTLTVFEDKTVTRTESGESALSTLAALTR